MSHFGFMCPPFLGHLNPMGVLARRLVARGHRATMFGMADMADMGGSVRDCGFVPLGRDTHPPGALRRMTDHMADPRGLKLFRIFGDMRRTTAMLCREAPDALRRHGVDTLVVDQLEPAGGLVAAHLGLPFVSVANALMIDREPAVPPPFTDWSYDPDARGLRRNRGGYRIADLMMAGMGRSLARQAEAWHLEPRRRVDAWLSPFAEVTQTVPSFDFPRAALPPTMHSCGPFRDPDAPASNDDLLGDGRPLVFASLGTLQGARSDVFHTIAETCRMLGLHLVIAHGGRLKAAAIASLPGRPVVRDFVPQRALLRHAALAITNGGLNTVLDALAAAVPLVVVPVAFEQGAIAARLARCGAGLSVPLRRLDVSSLAAAVARVRDEPGFAAVARRLATEIAEAGGAERAVDVIEAVATLKRPVTALEFATTRDRPMPLRVPA